MSWDPECEAIKQQNCISLNWFLTLRKDYTSKRLEFRREGGCLSLFSLCDSQGLFPNPMTLFSPGGSPKHSHHGLPTQSQLWSDASSFSLLCLSFLFCIMRSWLSLCSYNISIFQQFSLFHLLLLFILFLFYFPSPLEKNMLKHISS